jgi:hypothetical protein
MTFHSSHLLCPTLLCTVLIPAGCGDDSSPPSADAGATDDTTVGSTEAGDGSTSSTDDGVDGTANDETASTDADECEAPPPLAEGIALGVVPGIEGPSGLAVGPTSVLIYDRDEALLFSKAGGCPISIADPWGDLSPQQMWSGRLGERFVLAANPNGLESGTIVAIDDATGDAEVLLDDRLVFSFASNGNRAYFQTRDAEVMTIGVDGSVELLVEDGTQSVDDLSVYDRVRMIGDRVAMVHEDRHRILSWAGTPSDTPQTVFDGQSELDTFLTTITRSLLDADRIAFTTSTGNLTIASRGSRLYGAEEIFDEPPIDLGFVGEEATLVRIHSDAVDLVTRPSYDSPGSLVRQSTGGVETPLSALPVDSAFGVVFDGDDAWFVSGGALVVVDVDS